MDFPSLYGGATPDADIGPFSGDDIGELRRCGPGLTFGEVVALVTGAPGLFPFLLSMALLLARRWRAGLCHCTHSPQGGQGDDRRLWALSLPSVILPSPNAQSAGSLIETSTLGRMQKAMRHGTRRGAKRRLLLSAFRAIESCDVCSDIIRVAREGGFPRPPDAGEGAERNSNQQLVGGKKKLWLLQRESSGPGRQGLIPVRSARAKGERHSAFD